MADDADAPDPPREGLVSEVSRTASELTEARHLADSTAAQAMDAADHLEHERALLADEVLAAVEADDPILDAEVRAIVAGVDDDNPLGRPGAPLSARSPFRIAFSATLGVGSAYLLLQSVVLAEQVLVLVVVALFLAIGLEPAVDYLERHGVRRRWAVALVFAAVLLFFGGFLASVVPPISDQAQQLVSDTPGYLDRLQRDSPPIRSLNEHYHVIDQIKSQVANGPTLGLTTGGVLGIGQAILSGVLAAFTVLTLMLYFMSDFPGIKSAALRLIPRTRRARVGLITDEVLSRVGGYVLGNLATSVVAGLTSFVFCLAAGVPYPVALGLLIAITDLIPLVGATIGAALVTLVAFLTSIPAGIAAVVFFLIYQQIENYLLVPKIMKRTVDVGPLVTVIAALIGGTLLGIVGALLAIPVAAALQLFLQETVYPKQDGA